MDYGGSELELFSQATVWKDYWSKKIEPFITGNVIEVGSGISANTQLLLNDKVKRWTCLEPDPALCAQAQKNVSDSRCTFHSKTLSQLNLADSADTILYIDVLEHIANDKEEAACASRALRPGGSLVILSPAHNYLFSEFDTAIGHHRRYSKASLSQAIPSELKLQEMFYLDSIGFYASLANKLLLKQKQPTPEQILFWDRFLVRLSKIADPLTAHRFGKSIVGIWQK